MDIVIHFLSFYHKLLLTYQRERDLLSSVSASSVDSAPPVSCLEVGDWQIHNSGDL